MKAKDYFDKYESSFVENNCEHAVKATRDLLIDMSEEVEKLYNARSGKTNSALAGVIKEINQKWNAVGSLFEKKYGVSPLKRNGFIEFWKQEMPELVHIL